MREHFNRIIYTYTVALKYLLSNLVFLRHQKSLWRVQTNLSGLNSKNREKLEYVIQNMMAYYFLARQYICMAESLLHCCLILRYFNSIRTIFTLQSLNTTYKSTSVSTASIHSYSWFIFFTYLCMHNYRVEVSFMIRHGNSFKEWTRLEGKIGKKKLVSWCLSDNLFARCEPSSCC